MTRHKIDCNRLPMRRTLSCWPGSVSAGFVHASLLLRSPTGQHPFCLQWLVFWDTLDHFAPPWAISAWRSLLLTSVWNSSQILCFSPLCCSSCNEMTIVLHKSFKSIREEFEKIEALPKEVVYRIVWTYLIQWLGSVCFHLCIFKWRKRFYRFLYWVAFTSSLKTYFV